LREQIHLLNAQLMDSRIVADNERRRCVDLEQTLAESSRRSKADEVDMNKRLQETQLALETSTHELSAKLQAAEN